MSVRVSVRPSVQLFTFEVQFKRLLAPTSQSWMSKIVRDSESLGKSNGNKWSQILKLLLIMGVKSPSKKMFFGQILPYQAGVFWYWCYYPYWSRDSLSAVCGIFQLESGQRLGSFVILSSLKNYFVIFFSSF